MKAFKTLMQNHNLFHSFMILLKINPKIYQSISISYSDKVFTSIILKMEINSSIHRKVIQKISFLKNTKSILE